jgi:hypothetical protein
MYVPPPFESVLGPVEPPVVDVQYSSALVQPHSPLSKVQSKVPHALDTEVYSLSVQLSQHDTHAPLVAEYPLPPSQRGCSETSSMAMSLGHVLPVVAQNRIAVVLAGTCTAACSHR